MKNRAKKPLIKSRVNPLRLDPTRTALLRAGITKHLNKQFARLAFDIYNLVVIDDAFGLTNAVAANVFCATGPGGGIDPTCSPGDSKPNADDKPKPRKSKAKVRTGTFNDPRSDDQLAADRSELHTSLTKVEHELQKSYAAKPDETTTVHDIIARETLLKQDADRLKKEIQAVESVIRDRKSVNDKLEKLNHKPDDIPSLLGAADTAIVRLYDGWSDEAKAMALKAHVSDPAYSAVRTIYIDKDGNKVVHNDSFFIMATKANQGLGSSLFTDQVQNLSEAGYDRIETWAAKGPGMNGYYTWPRLGYDQQISEFRDKRTRDRISKAFPEAKSVLDIMATPEGREWWKVNGTNMRKAKFDLKPGSRSHQVLAAYLEERKARKKPTGNLAVNQYQPEPDNEDDIPPDSDQLEEIGDVDTEDFLTNAATKRQQWRFESTVERMRRFYDWLRTRMTSLLISPTEDQVWQAYAEEGFKKGAGRAFDDTRKASLIPEEKLSWYNGTRDQFLRSSFGQPVAVEKIKLLASRSFTDLKGVTEAMATQMSRVLTDGLTQGLSPRELSRSLVKTIDDIGRARALTIARTEIVRAHAEGQLYALDKLGVKEVGVAVEWSTTGDAKVCPMCQPMEGVVLRLEEATGLLPRHPNCRCAWIPANVSEDQTGQKRSAKRIQLAIKASKTAEKSKKGSGWGKVAITAHRPKDVTTNSIPEELIKFSSAIRNAFCPTGKGGGVDPTCSPGGRKKSATVGTMAGLSISPKIKDYLTKEETAKYNELSRERAKLLGKVRMKVATDVDRERAQYLLDEMDKIDAVGRERLKIGDKQTVDTTKPEVSLTTKLYLDDADRTHKFEYVKRDIERYRRLANEHDAALTKVQKSVAGLQNKMDRLEKEKVKLAEEFDKLNKSRPPYDSSDYEKWSESPEAKARSESMTNTLRRLSEIETQQEELTRMSQDQAWKLMRKGAAEVGITRDPVSFYTIGSANLSEQTRTKAFTVCNNLTGVLHENLVSQIGITKVEQLPPGTRAHFSGPTHGKKDSTVSVTADHHVATYAHEFGHSLEEIELVKSAATGFLYHRIGSEKAQHMGEGYDEHEVGRKDNFSKAFSNPAYVGKHYSSGSTEIVSMGLEQLHRNAAKFAKDDPEYFKLMYGILTGRFGT